MPVSRYLTKAWGIQGVTKRYATNLRTHYSHLEDEIKLYEHGSGNALFPFSPTLHST